MKTIKHKYMVVGLVTIALFTFSCSRGQQDGGGSTAYAASKTMQVEIDIDNPSGFIKPGMYAKALMQISRRESVLSLPVTAQWIFQNQPFVLVVKNDKVERIPLRKGLSNKDYVEVLKPEITESSLVIVQGKGLVQPGQIVKPVLKIK